MLPERQRTAREQRGRYLNRTERQCVAKRAHTWQSACTEADRLYAKGETTIRAYQCPQCGQAHVGRTRTDGTTKHNVTRYYSPGESHAGTTGTPKAGGEAVSPDSLPRA